LQLKKLKCSGVGERFCEFIKDDSEKITEFETYFIKLLMKVAKIKIKCISVFSVAKIEYVIINSNWMHEIMAGQKKTLRYSSESP
jgi:hypothetical protein